MLKVFADRGGTFTDLVGVTDDARLVNRLMAMPERFQITAIANDAWIVIYKLLSDQPGQYPDAVIQGIRDMLGLHRDQPIPPGVVEVVKMGTTVATNALLERKGERTLLLITQGFGDALQIGYQHRPHIFARQIILPERVYERVIEVKERYSAQGEEMVPIASEERSRLRTLLKSAYEDGIRAVAIAFLHSYRYPQHEQQIAELARSIGFAQVSVSHQISSLMKLIRRGETTVVDAYLSPILRRYVDQVRAALKQSASTTRLEFMKSDGGLTEAQRFQGKDSILSGPAGGIVGAIKTSLAAGFDRVIGFDMGGTSTDVSHYNGEYERTFETEVAGIRLCAPMMSIHTVAAGGGSILRFDGDRYRVGPESAGARPGPACYRQGGPLTVTDCNVRLGKIQPEFFPQVFGAEGNLPLDRVIVEQKFAALKAEINSKTEDSRTDEQVAAGFLAIAVSKMANAIKKISVQRGYDVTQYTLCCFGGAGGQHACLIAEALGMGKIFIHPFAGVLSAYGIGLAEVRSLKEKAVEASLTIAQIPELEKTLAHLKAESTAEVLAQQQVSEDCLETRLNVRLRYEGTDSALTVDFDQLDKMRLQFEELYRQRYGFLMPDKALVVEAVAVEAIAQAAPMTESPMTAMKAWLPRGQTEPLIPIATVKIYTKSAWHQAPVYRRQDLRPGDRLTGAALILEPTGTNVIEPGWDAEVTQQNCLILTQIKVQAEAIQLPLTAALSSTTAPDPVFLEIFNNLVRAIAEEMGVTLQNTSYSVNIKERLDFSCAIFDQHGQLVANAPHIPVHLGSMSESVLSLIRAQGKTLNPGDAYASNNPYNGGTHLPDITVITPVFVAGNCSIPMFYVASRGHHADIGGITPGSMPPHSQTIDQEGVLLDNVQIVKQGHFQTAELLELLTKGDYPARNPAQNLADLQAQIAANQRGVQALCGMVEHYGLVTVQAYMQHIQNNAEELVRQVIDRLKPGHFTYLMDNDSEIRLTLTIDRGARSVGIDFTGTSWQQSNNLNAPLAICKAVVLYVFRSLIEDDIPLNAGCLKPLKITVPEGCFLNPRSPAAVVAGNVETSQAIANALYGALGMLAASQGTMNNFTFGNQQQQYYETICGGSGAGSTFDGTDAVQTHMTNSRLTDPEVLEWRFPVLVEAFSIRANSGGNGAHRGGNGVIRRIQFRSEMTAAILSGHRIVPPFGLAGGEPGKVGNNSIERQDGTTELLSGKAEALMHPGDVFVIETPGGGGFGPVSESLK